MNFLAKKNPDRWYQLAWWLCVVTLPWIDMANNISLISLTLLWIGEGNFVIKWQRVKSSPWIWPFLIYYSILVVGLFYTTDFDNGLFTLDKKISFLILPLIMSTGKPLPENFVKLLNRSFVYSCCAVILICLVNSAYSFYKGGASANFDFNTYENFKAIHPDTSLFWTHFSYIQLAHWAGIHPGYLSMYLAFCLVILYREEYLSNAERGIHFAIGLLIVCFLALLTSRMAIIAFICCTFYFTLKEIQGKYFKTILFTVSFSFILLCFLLLNPVARYRVIDEPSLTTYRADRAVTNWNSVSYRLLEWEGGWWVISNHWLTGVGTGGAKMAMDNFYAHYNSTTVGLEHNAHNQYLQTWMESGILGLFVFLLCLWAGVFRLYKDSRYVCFILIFSLMCLTESIGERHKGIVFFMVFQALFLGLERRRG